MGGSLRSDDLDLGEGPLAPHMCHTLVLTRKAYVSGNPEHWAGSRGRKNKPQGVMDAAFHVLSQKVVSVGMPLGANNNNSNT